MKNIIADAGYFIALFDPDDRFHSRAWKVSEEYPAPLISTWPILTEATHILLKAGQENQLAFVKSLVDGACEIFFLQESHLARIHKLMEQYRDLPMDLADASLVVLAEYCSDGGD